MSVVRDLRFISRIALEFWNGLHFKRNSKPGVTVFGSARIPPSHPYCMEAKELGFELAKLGFSVSTGGGGAIMQAANEGAHDAGGESLGINIEIERESSLNPFVTHGIKSRYFFVRKVLLSRGSHAFVVFPGGFGTLDELFEVITLIQTQKANECPVILVDSQFWSGLLKWCAGTLVPNGMITESELARLKVVNTAKEALAYLTPLLPR
jgi:hypothetical protein